MEIWKKIKGYEGDYEVSNYGEIKSLKTNIILKGSFGKGYLHVGLCKKGVRTILRIHRLVALNFIPNPQNKEMVNHKNGVKTDNRLENVIWYL